jgi:transposase
MLEGFTLHAVHAGLTVYQTLQQQVDSLKQTVLNKIKLTVNYKIQKTITGIGTIIGLTVIIEIGDNHRSKGAINYVSYSPTVDSKRTSNSKN